MTRLGPVAKLELLGGGSNLNAGDESFLCKGQVLKYVGHGDTKTETRGLGKLGLLWYEVDIRRSGWFV